MQIVYKSLFSYNYIILLLRFLGKKECSQLSIHDFVVFLLIADLMVMGFDDNILISIVATLTLVISDYLTSFLSLKSKRIRDIVEGKPTHIVINGKLDIDAMRKCKYTCDSLSQHLRQSGISSLSEVAFASLETNGQLSVIKHKDNIVLQIEPVIIDGLVQEAVLERCGYNRAWLKKELKGLDFNEIMYAVIEKKRLFFLKK